MASLIVVCILVAGSAVAVGFSGIFFAKLIIDYIKENKTEEVKAEVKAEEPKTEEVEEIDLDQMLATLEARAKEAEEEKAEEKEETEEVAEQPVPEVAEPVAEPVVEQKEEIKEEPKAESKTQIIFVEPESDLDYEARLAKAKEAFEKLEKDYQKNTKALNKYKRTEKKKAKNERLLNKKAAELASLNLSVYNVKELADVDPDKKAKQEELTTHVAELKAAIMEAEEYLEKNREKHNQELKLNTYLEKEHARYEEEIKSLEEFLAKKDSNGTEE